MNAIKKAISIYKAHYGKHEFAKDLKSYLLKGHVICSPEVLILAKPVNKGVGKEDQQWGHSNCNAWFIYLLVKKNEIRFSDLFTLMPYELDYIGWRRSFKRSDCVVRYYKMEQMKKRMKG